MHRISQTSYGESHQAEFASHANSLRSMITDTLPGKTESYFSKGWRIANGLPSEGFVGHMGGHIALGTYYLGLAGGYEDDFAPLLNGFAASLVKEVTNNDWVTSDIAHAQDTIGYLAQLYELQEDGLAPSDMITITTSHLSTVGDSFVTGGYSVGSTPISGSLVGMFGVAADFSSLVENRIQQPGSYPLTAGNGSFQLTYEFHTLASIAHSYAISGLY